MNPFWTEALAAAAHVLVSGPALDPAPAAVGYLVYLGVSIVFVATGLALSAWLRRYGKRAGGASVAYEGGEEPQGTPWIAWQPRYFVVALVFLVFEVELIFMFPLAMALPTSPPMLALIEGVLFVVLLGLGLVFAWAGGWLTWPAGKATKPQPWQGAVPESAYAAIHKKAL